MASLTPAEKALEVNKLQGQYIDSIMHLWERNHVCSAMPTYRVSAKENPNKDSVVKVVGYTGDIEIIRSDLERETDQLFVNLLTDVLRLSEK